MTIETNKIYNGNCYELIKEIPDKSVDLLYTDVPYLMCEHQYENSELGQRKKKVDLELNKQDKVELLEQKAKELKEKMDNATSKDEYEKWHCQRGNVLNKINLMKKQDITKGFDYSILDEFVRVMKHIYIYIWCSKDQIYDLMKYFIEKHNCKMNILVWCKTNCVPATNNSWLPNIEYCLVFKGKGAPRYNDGYSLKSKWYMSGTNKNDKDSYGHPTIKMYEQVKQHLLHSTNEGDLILDPFCGSGTTCAVAKEIKRKYIGFELNEDYYKIAVDRLNGINQKGEIDLFSCQNDDEEINEQLSIFEGE